MLDSQSNDIAFAKKPTSSTGSAFLYLKFVKKQSIDLYDHLLWYGLTLMSYANLSDMLPERGISVNRSIIYRWFIEHSLKLRKKLRRNYQFIRTDRSW